MSDIHPVKQRPIRDSIVQGVVAGATIIVTVIVLSIFMTNNQEESLNEIKQSNRAIACVLVLPVSDNGRIEADVNSLCLVPNGLEPGDWNKDGTVEFDGPR